MAEAESLAQAGAGNGLASRVVILAYSVVSYALFLASIGWLIASSAGLCPFGTGPLSVGSTAAALAVNAGLLVLFGVQHSVMARQRFKDWWTTIIPPAAERSTYVLTAALTLGLMIWLWQPMDTVIWSTSEPAARALLWSLSAFGWLYLVAATFVTSHFDLFGLRQAWLHLGNRPYTPVPFVRTWMYRYSRHPMMAGILLGLWANPDMQADQLVLAAGLSAYIAVGVTLEERELAGHFGEKYRQYCREVGALLPRLRA
jgi:protein-S-isoprenylcysteine O-methyltransferase Ste14